MTVYGSKEGYDLYANMYDSRLEFLSGFERDVFMRMLGNVRGKRVLDIGCGTGRITGILRNAGAIVTACDISEEMLKIVKKKFSDVETVLADIEHLPFEDGTFDIVTAMFLIVHLKNPKKAFDEVYRTLKDGGRFILSNINQRKAPKLETKKGEKIVIKSFYHMPRHVLKALEERAFEIEDERFIYEQKVWINQIIKAKK